MKDIFNTIYATCLFGLALVTFWSIFAVGSSCANSQQTQAQPKPIDPIEEAKGKCYLKRYSARPACWSEGDWLVYCQRVQCFQPRTPIK